MKNFKPLIVIVALLIIANCVLVGLLWYRNYSKPKTDKQPGGPAFEYLTRELKLSPQQSKQYKAMVAEHRNFTREVNDDQRARRDSFFDYLKEPNVDKAEIDALEKRIINDQRRLDSATFYHFRAFRAILTPVQQSHFDEVINSVLHMMARPQGGPGGNHPGMQGPTGQQPPIHGGRQMGPPESEGMPPQRQPGKPAQGDGKWIPPHLDSTMRPLLDSNGRQIFGPQGEPIFVPKNGKGRRPFGPPPGGRPPLGPDGRPMGPPPGDGPPPHE